MRRPTPSSTTTTTTVPQVNPTYRADCPLGPIQAAVLDPTSTGWIAIDVPVTVSGSVRQALAVGNRVLVDISDAETAQDTFALIDPTAHTWQTVAPPARGQPEVVCASQGTAFAINVRTKTRGVWSDSGDQMANDGQGQVQVSALGPTDATWSGAGPQGLPSASALVKTGCVGGGVLLVGDDGQPGHPADTSFWQPGDAQWQPVAPPPASPTAAGTSVGLLALVPLDHDRVTPETDNAGSRVFDGASHAWATIPTTEPDVIWHEVHIGRSALGTRTGDDQMVAFTT